MELSLDLSLVYVPETISECLKEVSKVQDGSQKLFKINDYMKRLEEERKKIDAFKRELPLCMLLLNDAIMRLEEEAMHWKEPNEDQAVIEEGLPSNGNIGDESNDASDDKSKWMSSVQLWSSNGDVLDGKEQVSLKSAPKQCQRTDEDDDRSTCENPIQSCNQLNGGGGAFVPFKGRSAAFEGVTGKKEEKEVVSQVTGLSLMTSGSELGFCNLISESNDSNQMKKIKTQQLQQQGCRKQRRSWSPELHRRFVDALEQLGGSQVATPKQIRELMQVDGLTNDEVKSHLQKYRLHIRRLPTSAATDASGMIQSDQDSNLNNNTLSVSPRGPLHANTTAKSISTSGSDSMEAEDDDRSESHWNGRLGKPGEVTAH